MRSIIVITPIKNEEWILETFLKATSCFADHIILADQNSTDRSLEIANQFSKAVVIKNNSGVYDEASRQRLLIETARQLYGYENILLAIDADEIITYSSLKSAEWRDIHNAEPGTVLYIETPTFYNSLDKVLTYDRGGGKALGFIDDGTEHEPVFIHSTRVPVKEGAPKIHLKEIKFLHCNLLSLARHRSKIRYYCLLESLAKSRPWYHRIVLYNKRLGTLIEDSDGVINCNPAWTDGWIESGLSFREPKFEKYYWFDRESLHLLMKWGGEKFWMEDVWDIDWDDAAHYFEISGVPVSTPPRAMSFVRDKLYYVIKFMLRVKKTGKKAKTQVYTSLTTPKKLASMDSL